MTKKLLLDTNILVYSWDTSSKFYKASSKFLKSLDEFYISDRSLLEFYRTYTGPIKASSKDTLEIINYYLDSKKCHILYSDQTSNLITFELAQQNQARSGKIFDLNILATALSNDIDILYTKNTKDYPSSDFIEIIDPTL